MRQILFPYQLLFPFPFIICWWRHKSLGHTQFIYNSCIYLTHIYINMVYPLFIKILTLYTTYCASYNLTPICQLFYINGKSIYINIFSCISSFCELLAGSLNSKPCLPSIHYGDISSRWFLCSVLDTNQPPRQVHINGSLCYFRKKMSLWKRFVEMALQWWASHSPTENPENQCR